MSITTKSDLDTAIAEKEILAERLRKAAADLPIVESDLATLLRAKEILSGANGASVTANVGIKPGGVARRTIANSIEAILSEVRELHANEVLRQLEQRFGIKTSKQVVVGTILRYANNGRKFRRTKPNTFALVK